MPANSRKRQKKQEQRAAKRKLKHQQLARAKQAGFRERLADADRYPILDSWVSEDLFSEGMGWIGLSRRLPNGFIAAVIFLVDRYCLGVKDAMAKILGASAYAEQLQRTRERFDVKNLPPETIRKFVEGAVAYAASLGLPPHPDYRKAKLIFGSISADLSTEQLEFGQDGKPMFIAGPNDDALRCRRILQALEASRGPGGFHYVIPGSDMDDLAIMDTPEAPVRLEDHTDEPDTGDDVW
jgi:hypothetical protein